MGYTWIVLLLLSGCLGPSIRESRPAVATHSPRADIQAHRQASLFDGMYRDAYWVMGTRLVLALEAPAPLSGAELSAEAHAIVDALDQLLSHYRNDSPLSRLNRHELNPPFPAELVRFAKRAEQSCYKSGGRFDITVGALTAQTSATKALDGRPDRALPIGCRNLHVQGDQIILRSGARLDPGGIGKGYAVDAMVATLRTRGVQRAFIDFGGSSFYGLGQPLGYPGWPVLIQGVREQTTLGVVYLRDRALASSHSFSEKRPHIFDPRDQSIVRERRIAAVVSPSATDAEVLSKALIVDPSAAPALTHQFTQMSYLMADARGVAGDLVLDKGHHR